MKYSLSAATIVFLLVLSAATGAVLMSFNPLGSSSAELFSIDTHSFCPSGTPGTGSKSACRCPKKRPQFAGFG